MTAITLALALAVSAPAPVRPSDSVALAPCGSYPFSGGTALALDHYRQLAFVGSGGGVLVVDISDPATPTILSDAIRCQATVISLWLDHDRLYVGLEVYYVDADVERDVEIWDVGVPTSPVRLGSLDLTMGGFAVWARDSLLLVSTYPTFMSWSVGDPASPRLLDSTTVRPAMGMIRVRDTLAFCAVSASPLHVYSIADPTELRLLSRWGMMGEYPAFQLEDSLMFVSSGYGPLGSWSGLRVYDISDPLNGQQIGALDTVETGAFRVAVRDTLALLTHYRGGRLSIITVADPTQPRELAQYGTTCTGADWFDSLGTVVFHGRLALLDLTDPTDPIETGNLPIAWTGSDFALVGQHVITLGRNLSVLDRSGPELERIGSLALPEGFGLELSAVGPRALAQLRLTYQARLLCFVDLSDPTSPALAALDTVETSRMALAVRDTLGFVATNDSLLVYNLARMSAPERIGGLEARLVPSRLLSHDSLLFVAGYPGRIINVADPTAPVLLATLDTGSIKDVTIADSMLYAIDDYRMFGYSIADPERPRRLFRINASGDRLCVADTLLVTGSHFRTLFYSIADPVAPVLVGRNCVEGGTDGLAVVGDTLYTSALRRFLIRPLTAIAEPPAVPVIGQPAAPGVVRGTLRLPAVAVRLQYMLLDASGRKVMELQPGENDVRRLAPGVYFIRAGGTGGREQDTRKVVIQR
jgi:hypothetical protein